jgi:hypothetical protein
MAASRRQSLETVFGSSSTASTSQKVAEDEKAVAWRTKILSPRPLEQEKTNDRRTAESKIHLQDIEEMEKFRGERRGGTISVRARRRRRRGPISLVGDEVNFSSHRLPGMQLRRRRPLDGQPWRALYMAQRDSRWWGRRTERSDGDPLEAPDLGEKGP